MKEYSNSKFLKSINRTILLMSLLSGLASFSFMSAGYLMISDDLETSQGLQQPVSSEITFSKEANDYTPFIMADKVEIMAGDSQVKTPAASLVPEQLTASQKPIAATVKVNLSKHTHVLKSNAGSKQMANDFRFESICIDDNLSVIWVVAVNTPTEFLLEKLSVDGFKPVEAKPVITVDRGYNYYKVDLENDQRQQYSTFRLQLKADSEEVLYSKEIMVENCNNIFVEPQIDVFPIGYGSFKITVLSARNDHFEVTLTDLNEIELITESFDVVKGENEFLLESGKLPRGNYNLKVSNSEVVEIKMVTLK